MKTIFFHMNQLGDLLFSLPALAAARKQWPGNVIYCVAKPEHLEIIKEAGLADVLIPKNPPVLQVRSVYSRGSGMKR